MPVAYNIHNQVINPWTEAEEIRLRKMKGSTKEELLKAFPNRTWSAIRGKAKKLKIRKLVKRVPWNKGETKIGNKIIRQMSETRWNRYRKNGKLLLRKPDLSWTRKEHDDLLLEELKLMKENGFRCIPLTKILPDAIAIKDGKVYAIELETNSPNYDKYINQIFFDDIIWIVYRFRSIRRNAER